MNTPLQMFVMMLAGWLNEQQRAVHAYLKEENRVLRELHGHKRLRFSHDQRKRLAAKGHALGRRVRTRAGAKRESWENSPIWGIGSRDPRYGGF